jgi:hypothetical protein
MSQVPFLKEVNDRFAAIEATALGNALPSAQIIVGSAGGVSAAVDMSGDVTITNAGVTAIGANKVTSAKLATGILPSHVVKYAGSFTTVGGDVNEAIAVAGVAATDIALVFLKTAGVAPVTVVSAAAALNAVNVVMSADPAADHVLSYVVLRAIA